MSIGYSPPRLGPTIELDLSKNEGRAAPEDLLSLIDTPSELMRRYPRMDDLRTTIADRIGVAEHQVLITAGGDDALLRCLLAYAGNGGKAVATRPSFEMIPVYAGQIGASLTELDWRHGPFPTSEFAKAASYSDIAIVVSPNNPTGAVVAETDLLRVSRSAQIVVLDAAYTEFAEQDLTQTALDQDNVLVVRTFSKAYGLAGLRVGYLLGPAAMVEKVSSYGSPYAVSSLSVALAAARLAHGTADVAHYIASVRKERAELTCFLQELGVEPLTSQGNFVLAEVPDPPGLVEKMAEAGVGIRHFPGRAGLEDSVRITIPGEPAQFARLLASLEFALAPLTKGGSS